MDVGSFSYTDNKTMIPKSSSRWTHTPQVDFIEDWALLMKSDCLPKLSYSLVASHTQPRRRPKGTFEADGSFRHVTPEELAAEDDSEPSGEDGKPGKSGVIQLSSSSSENKEPVLGGAASSSSASRGGPPNAMAASGAGGAAAKPKQSQFGAVTPKSNFPSAAGQSSQFAKSPALKPSQFGKSPAPLKPSQFGASKPAFPPAQPSPVASTVMPAKLPKTPSSAPPPGATDAGNGGSQPDGPTSKKRTYASAFGSASPKQSPGQAVQPAVLPAAVPAAASPRLTREELEKKKATAKAKRAAVLAKKQAEAASVGPASAGSSASGLSA